MKGEGEPGEPGFFLPLSAAALHILLALAAMDRHGYGIMLEVARQSEGRYKLGPGTLYDNLQKLLDRGLVKEAPRRSPNEDPRRRYYRMTPFGRRVRFVTSSMGLALRHLEGCGGCSDQRLVFFGLGVLPQILA